MLPGATPDGGRGVPARRRYVTASMLRSVLVAAGLLVAYFVLPMTRLQGGTLIELLIGVVALAALIGWQLLEITRSPYPRMRAVEMLVTSVVAFLTVFATTYYVMGQENPGDFTERLSKLDSAYFTVTIFATVGFGDITAVSQGARAVTMVQMLGDLVIVGVVARMVMSAVRLGVERQETKS